MSAARVLGVIVATVALSGGAWGQEFQRFGEWSSGWSKENNASYAITSNESGSALVMECRVSTGKCRWILAGDVRCDSGEAYNVLASSSVGATAFEMTCISATDDPKGRLSFNDYSLAYNVITDGDNIGIAVAMESGRFRVIRFSLSGSSKSARHALELFRGRSTKSPAMHDESI